MTYALKESILIIHHTSILDGVKVGLEPLPGDR